MDSLGLWPMLNPAPPAENVDGWTALARTADLLGLAAFVIVVLGLVTSYVTRPRLRIQPSAPADGQVLVVFLSYEKGSRSARNLNAALRAVDTAGHSVSGDDRIWQRAALLPGDGHWFNFWDASLKHPGPNDIEGATWIQIDKPLGVLLSLTWEHPLVPWFRARRVVAWTASARTKGEPPVILKGRRAASIWSRAMTSA